MIDATLKREMPPLALPKREYMERARELWDDLGLPALNPESPWHGYSLGDWSDEWDAVWRSVPPQGEYLENGKRSANVAAPVLNRIPMSGPYRAGMKTRPKIVEKTDGRVGRWQLRQDI